MHSTVTLNVNILSVESMGRETGGAVRIQKYAWFETGTSSTEPFSG